MPVSGTSASLLRGVQAFHHSFLMFRVSKFRCSCLSSDPESLEALAFEILSFLRTYFTLLYTRELRSLPLAGRFLTTWTLTRSALPPRAVNQVNFMTLACASMNLHKFMSCPGPCRGKTGEFFFFLLILLAPSSKGFAAWYEPLLCVDLADWWHSLDCLFFLFW